MRKRITVFVALLLAGAGSASGQSSDDPVRFLVWPIEDLRAATASAKPSWIAAAAGAGVGIYLISRYDRGFTERSAQVPDTWGLRVVEEFGNAKTMRPALALVFVGALMAGETRLQDAAFTSLESVVVANVFTNSMKSIFGRARPWQSDGPNQFEPFSGRTSFPSGHATTVFAALTPFAVYYGGKVGIALFAVATATAFSRMASNVHWFSDVVAGSAVGFVTGWSLSRRHLGGRLTVAPAGTGAALQLRF